VSLLGTMTLVNKDSEQVVATLKGHQKKVTHVIHHFEEVKIEVS